MESRVPSCASQVALLIDFENVVFGLKELHGEDRVRDHLRLGGLIQLAQEHGRVTVTNAYADWALPTFNTHQNALNRRGIEMVHVRGRRGNGQVRKNATDVRLAVDAMELLLTLPHLETFVLVSGDGDYVHLLRALHRFGKTVVGVGPDHSIHAVYASLCDRFVRYSNLPEPAPVAAGSAGAGTTSIAQTATVDLAPLAERIRQALAGDARYVGLQVGQLRATLHAAEPAVATASPRAFQDVLRQLADTVRVETGPGGQNWVLPADAEPSDVIWRRRKLMEMVGGRGFVVDPARRAAALEALHVRLVGGAPATVPALLEALAAAGVRPVEVRGLLHVLEGAGAVLVVGAGDETEPRQVRLARPDAAPADLRQTYEDGVRERLVRRGEPADAAAVLLAAPPRTDHASSDAA